ncbi:MAG: zinc transporter ZntB [Rhodospirillaceae bacterium]
MAETMPADWAVDGLVAAYVLDGKGGGREVDWAGVRAWTPDQGVLWVHLEQNVAQAAHWIQNESGLDPVVSDALLAAETRPRAFSEQDGFLVILRGVNLNPGAVPEDMVGLRMWLRENLIVTVRRRPLMAVVTMRERLARGRGATGAGDFLAQVAGLLVERMGPVIGELHDGVDALEDGLGTLAAAEIREGVYAHRHQAILLRRYLAPQREVLARLAGEQQPWLPPRAKMELREVADRTLRYVEELDEVRERAVLLKDELIAILSEKTNRTMYLLTVVAAIMLPLSFLTGLLGINVKGVPGAETDWAFIAVCAIMLVIGVIEIWLFRKWRWL